MHSDEDRGRGGWPTQARLRLEWGLASYAYTLGNAGNRTAVAELNSRSVAYGYDNDYRLSSEAITADPAGNNGTVGYTYDVVSNRFSMTSTL